MYMYVHIDLIPAYYNYNIYVLLLLLSLHKYTLVARSRV